MREIRSSGSVRGVRSDPYPYRDPIPPDAVGGVLFTPSGGLGSLLFTDVNAPRALRFVYRPSVLASDSGSSRDSQKVAGG